MSNIPRPEYPRPQLVRPEWINLNGMWSFEIDRELNGYERGLNQKEAKLSGEIAVPFCPESKLSGIGDTSFMKRVWYKRSFNVKKVGDKRIILHFGACDYYCRIWINGVEAGLHRGGFSSFEFDITSLTLDGDNEICVCADDDTLNVLCPSGKQSDEEESYGCLYTRTTGIWQTVWLEYVSLSYIKHTKYTPVTSDSSLLIEIESQGADGMLLTAEASFNGRFAGRASCAVCGGRATLLLRLNELILWDIGKPNLYDLTLTLGQDTVESYFGMRDISVNDGCMYINGKPVYQNLVLDQGYYPDSLMTAPTDAELEADVDRGIAMGFNGARLHQKVFEERYLYYCDKKGYIVWGEFGNWGLDNSLDGAWEGFFPEWLEVLRRDCNHPSIVGWIPFNETGTNQNQALVKFTIDMTHSYDPARLVVGASGWAHINCDPSDMLDWHDYTQDPDTLREFLSPLETGDNIPMRDMEGSPSFISEFGGIWWNPDKKSENGWGYGDPPKSDEEFLTRLRGLTQVLRENKGVHAICYTQLTDIEQEQNGLYTYSRKAKFDPSVIRKIIQGK